MITKCIHFYYLLCCCHNT